MDKGLSLPFSLSSPLIFAKECISRTASIVHKIYVSGIIRTLPSMYVLFSLFSPLFSFGAIELESHNGKHKESDSFIALIRT